jgi:cobyrinic acid a,c-diamide synthase
MAISQVPRILVAGSRSASGKSLVTTGLLLAFRRRGLSVSCCVAGRAIQQSTLLHRLSDRYVPVLDRSLISDDQVCDAVGQAGIGADIILIDGHAGFFDGSHAFDFTGSDADLASLLSCPCVLVVDALEVSNSLCAIVSGLVQFQETPNIVGVILSGLKPSSPGKTIDPVEERNACNELFSAANLPPCLGCIPAQELGARLPASNIFQEENNLALPRQLFADIEQLVSGSVDVDGLLGLASGNPPIACDEIVPVVGRGVCRIAVASDNCFHVCYQDNLALLQAFGAELVRFSPLVDSVLPPHIGGIYLPGACLSDYAQEVESNKGLLAAIADFIRLGGIVFSEGGGSAILCASFRPTRCERAFEGAGSIPYDAYQAHGVYAPVRGTILDGCLFGEFGTTIGALYAGDWQLAGPQTTADGAPDVMTTLRIESPSGVALQEGYSVSAETFSTFHFLHFGSNPQFARALVEAAAIHQKSAGPRRG